MPVKTQPYVLGIDLGSASVGWALTALDGHANHCALIRAGVHVFDPGVAGSQLDILKGQNQSKAVDRRVARLQRRQLRRRAARQRDLFEKLQEAGLLPKYSDLQRGQIASARKHVLARSEARHIILNDLDRCLLSKWRKRMDSGPDAVPAGTHVLPYFLRAMALREALQPEELGRVIYSLGQRRGFWSNRKSQAEGSKEEKQGVVKKNIGRLEGEIGDRTLGEFFSQFDPTHPRWLQDTDEQRIRNRYTHRDMFKQEFESIWAAQQIHHPELMRPELKQKIFRMMFDQRPIARQGQLVGECEFEKGHKRMPMAGLEAQRFRLLQKANDIVVALPGETERTLTDDEWRKLVDKLEFGGDLKLDEVKTLLGFGERAKLNLESGGETNLPGNRTAVHMRAVFGDRWQAFSIAEKNEAIEFWRLAENDDELVRGAVQRWGLSEIKAKQWAKKHAEPKYCRLSLAAINRILPRMEKRERFQAAADKEYGIKYLSNSVYLQLPPVWKAATELRNPAVARALTELRKLVNAIVREYGKPYKIRIELARELKLALRDREARWKRYRDNEERRKAAKRRILQQYGFENPSELDIKKALLWEECNEICPYTSRHINFRDLFDKPPQFEIEHILPRNRVADNSMDNLTLCEAKENREKKGGQTPFEAYGNTPQWEEIIKNVKRMNNPRKLERFQVQGQADLAKFQSRRLNDTAYASKLAAQYVGLLYGGRDIQIADGTTRRAVFTSTGELTADLRKGWDLEKILKEIAPSSDADGSGKPRADHRHHAVDAIVTALSEHSWIEELAKTASKNFKARGRETYTGLRVPWDGFVDEVRSAIHEMKVSHRPQHKLSGCLHAETNYSPRKEGEKPIACSRSFVHRLSAKDISSSDVIVDSAVRLAIQRKLEEVGGDPRKLVGPSAPFLVSRTDGRKIPIYRVRVKEILRTVSVGRFNESKFAPPQRHVKPNNNHHIEIIAQLDDQGKTVEWRGETVSLLEALQRKNQNLPIIRRNHGSGYEFQFSLMVGDLIEASRDAYSEIWLVRSLTTVGQIYLSRHTDARLEQEIKNDGRPDSSGLETKRRRRKKGTGAWWTPKADALREAKAVKITIDLLGRVHYVDEQKGIERKGPHPE